jgi:group I intron endonuclease
MNNNNKINNNLAKPLMTFNKPLTNKAEIGKVLQNKAGIYQWYNPVNGFCYIGSSANLKGRFFEYCYSMNQNKLNRTLSRGNSIIFNTLSKNGMDSFEFRILEFIDLNSNNNLKTELFLLEQAYLDAAKPEYNILKLAGSNRGHRLSVETRAKMSNAKKLQYLLKPSSRKGSKANELTRFLMFKNNKIAKKVYVYNYTDTPELQLLYVFDSIKQACLTLNYYPARLVKFITNKLILDNKFIVSWDELTKESIKDYYKSNTNTKKTGTKVYVYLVDEFNNPKILVNTFNSVLNCSKFYNFSDSKTYRLINKSQINNTFEYLNQRYILSNKSLL